MTTLWKRSTYKGQHILLLADKAQKKLAIELASKIPGADVESDASVSGSDHALEACLEVAGQTVDWEWSGPKAKPIMHDKLPPFQRQGSAIIRDLIESGVMCNDDIGLGKTIQTIAAMQELDPKPVRLVLCPAFLRRQWKEEIEKWAPIFGLKTDGIGGGLPKVHIVWPKSDKRVRASCPSDVEWVVAFYLDLERALACFPRRRGYYLIIDEIHNTAGYGTTRADYVEQASTFAVGRVGLTANKLYNRGDRLYRMLSFVTPGQWGGYGDWVARYAGGVQNEWGGWEIADELSHVDELRHRMAAMSFRRLKQDVFEQLPFEAKFQTIWLDPPRGALAMLADQKANGKISQTHMAATAEAKVDAVVGQAQADAEAGLPSLNFTYLREQAQQIHMKLPGSKLILGGTDAGKRLEEIHRYCQMCEAGRRIPMLVSTIDALREGANLQRFKTVNFGGLSYTPDDVLQAAGRTVRMGQEGTVTVRFFMAKATQDEHYAKILTSKLKEQQKLEGRAEPDKSKFEEALSPGNVKDLAAKMLAKYRKLEQESKS